MNRIHRRKATRLAGRQRDPQEQILSYAAKLRCTLTMRTAAGLHPHHRRGAGRLLLSRRPALPPTTTHSAHLRSALLCVSTLMHIEDTTVVNGASPYAHGALIQRRETECQSDKQEDTE